ncbi:MAG: PAS domain S-box protein [Rhodopseudomonas palustris]|nr:MAG: PAS domain S-box protein [Rhodopseudomonas palustris]
MTNTNDQLRGVDDPRLAVHATSARAAWLWTLDGARIIWANPVGARVFGAGNSAALAATPLHPADGRRRQIARLAPRLTGHAPRLERLRGFGAAIGALTTCACSRLEFSDGSAALLIVTAEPVPRPMPMVERLQCLVEGIDTPIASFAPDGLFIGASAAAQTLIGFRDLSNGTMDAARQRALAEGRAELPIGIGHMVLQRIGSGAEVALVALLAPGPAEPHSAASPPPPEPQADESNIEAAPVMTAPARPEPEPEPEPTPAEIAGPEIAAEPEAVIETEPSAPEQSAKPIESEPAEITEPGLTDQTASEPALAAPPAEHQPCADAQSATQAVEDNAEEAPPQTATADTDNEPDAEADAVEGSPAWYEEPLKQPRRHPLRFTWQLDAEQRFSIGSDEFSRLIGPRTAAGFGRPWREIADLFQLDPDGAFAAAIASRRTWSGVTLQWPVDGPQQRLAVELSGLPAQDYDGRYIGYRGFGVCHDLEALDRLAALRRGDDQATAPLAQPLSADRPQAATAPSADHFESDARLDAALLVPPTVPDMPLDTPHNVLPFRPANDDRALVLTPVENNAFDELARQLSARLQSDGPEGEPADSEPTAEPSVAAPEPTEPLSVTASQELALIDLLPIGVLLYRLDRLIHANPAFLNRMGFASFAALQAAGGVDALLVETESGDNHSIDVGSAIIICPAHASAEHPCPPARAQLHAIEWDGEPALALMLAAAAQAPTAPSPSIVASAPSAAGHASAEELGAILDGAAEAIVMFDAEGRITACNRATETLFGYRGDELLTMTIAELIAPASRDELQRYLTTVKQRVVSEQDLGRELQGRTKAGSTIALSARIGRTSTDGDNYFVMLHDLSQQKQSEAELTLARRQADHAASAKTDALARLSHEIRIPLNAMLGFAEVMIEERFGPLGNERYAEYMKDIRASGERVIAIVDDLLELARIESGRIDLNFAELQLNEIVEHSVAALQPQANRARIIMRSSLAQQLPTISADAPALRQIVESLIATSIQLANAGGQVIISTALSDAGEVMLRVRDTGDTLNKDELAAAMQPFRSAAPSDAASEASAVSLSLTRALVEANRGRFQIKTAPHSGTLIEVVFAPAKKA